MVCKGTRFVVNLLRKVPHVVAFTLDVNGYAVDVSVLLRERSPTHYPAFGDALAGTVRPVKRCAEPAGLVQLR